MKSAISHLVSSASSIFGSHQRSDGIKTSTWKDKRVCFDLGWAELELDNGEQLIGSFFPIEDIKGNSDELGLLQVTNLRLIWIHIGKKRRVNLSIGWHTVTWAYEQNLKDTLSCSLSSLFVLCKYENTKYEFVFRCQQSDQDPHDPEFRRPPPRMGENLAIMQLSDFSLSKSSVIDQLTPKGLEEPFNVVLNVWQAYKETYLFRHCRSNLSYLVVPRVYPDTELTGNCAQSSAGKESVLKLSDIQKLPGEKFVEVFMHVTHNESPTVKRDGTLVLTNVRILWIHETNHERNFSIPYLRIDSIKLKPGDKIQVSTHERLISSSSRLEFQAHRDTKTAWGALEDAAAKSVPDQIRNLYLLYQSKPRYGPESCEDSINFMGLLRPIRQLRIPGDLESKDNFGPKPATERGGIIVTSDDEIKDQQVEDKTRSRMDDVENAERDLDGYATKILSYLNEQPLPVNHELIYYKDFGLAMERPANGADIDAIWKIWA